MTMQAISEAPLHALADGVLPEEQRAAIDAHLRAHPQDAARVDAWREQNRQLRALFDPVLDEAVPPRLMQAASPPAANGAWQRHAMQAAAAIVLVIAGGAGGWLLRGDGGDSTGGCNLLPRRFDSHCTRCASCSTPTSTGWRTSGV